MKVWEYLLTPSTDTQPRYRVCGWLLLSAPFEPLLFVFDPLPPVFVFVFELFCPLLPCPWLLEPELVLFWEVFEPPCETVFSLALLLLLFVALSVEAVYSLLVLVAFAFESLALLACCAFAALSACFLEVASCIFKLSFKPFE